MPMPRMSSFTDTFASLDNIEESTDYLGNSSEVDWVYTGYLTSYNDALLLQMPNGSSGTVVSSTKYLWYGKIGVTVKSSRDKGVVTAFITFSDVQDEIDFEFMGYNLTNPQTNYYAQGILNYTNSRNTSATNTYENWHYYEVDWQEDYLTWLIDGEVVRTLEKENTYNETADRYNYPQTPSRIQFSLWPGGSTLNSVGTIEWAGGEIDWDSDDITDYGYYYAYVKNFTVETNDLPSGVKLVGSNSSDELHAFLYNSTLGDQDNVYLTNETTWLGSDGATGFDRQQDLDSDSATTVVVVLSGSSEFTSTKTVSKSTSKVTTADTATTTTSEWSGGFVQDTHLTASDSSNSSTTSSSSSKSGATTVSYRVEAVLAAVVAVGATVFAFGI